MPSFLAREIFVHKGINDSKQIRVSAVFGHGLQYQIIRAALIDARCLLSNGRVYLGDSWTLTGPDLDRIMGLATQLF